ncbi:hypothetical protein IFR05_006703 [Cadophora sp. M221]|nr:hypothetical protein IFR05_006703 [Cadophora sp. M221]
MGLTFVPTANARGEQLHVGEMDLEIIVGLDPGLLTSEQLVKVYIAQIQQVDENLHSIACLNRDAIYQARERDAQRLAKNIIGSLHGVPILVKDMFATLDAMPSTGGSLALAGATFKREATIITKLKESGAIILGKTNLSEWGMSRSNSCPNGWSALFGQAMGAYSENQDPQGSSSGSAIAMSMSFASATIGGETSGSILYPAQRNGVIGLKPSCGLTSRFGSVPINSFQDSIGPLTRRVKDGAIILQVIAEKDALDPETANIPFDTIPDYPAACVPTALRGVRVAAPLCALKVVNAESDVLAGWNSAISVIESLGAIVIENIDFPEWRPSTGMREDLFDEIMLREGQAKFFANLDINPCNISSTADVIEFLKTAPEERYDKFGASTFEAARDAPGSSKSPAFVKSKEHMGHLGKEVARLLGEHDCDVMIGPSSMDMPLDLGGLPGISVPIGFYSTDRKAITIQHGLITKGPNIPFSFTFVARRFTEESLVGFAYAFEQATLFLDAAKSNTVRRPTADLDTETLVVDIAKLQIRDWLGKRKDRYFTPVILQGVCESNCLNQKPRHLSYDIFTTSACPH